MICIRLTICTKQAVALVYEMILAQQKAQPQNIDGVMDNGKKLIHHMNYIYSWYQAIKEPFGKLSQ